MTHSAAIDMTLLVRGKTYSVDKVGPSRMLLGQEVTVPLGPAIFTLTIDGKTRSRPVTLLSSDMDGTILYTMP